MNLNDLISTKEAAKLGKCSLATIYRWIRKGVIAQVVSRAGRTFIPRDVMVRLFRERPKVVVVSQRGDKQQQAKASQWAADVLAGVGVNVGTTK
jgi:excisionase family DNA binding protein